MSGDVQLNILAIESSCDETAAAVIANGKIRSHALATQSVHKSYGGVVPELASRAHQQHMVSVVKSALDKATLALADLHAVAFTRGPGLLGGLLVGTSFAKSLAFARDIPLIGVNHMQAHVLSHFIEGPYPPLPFLCLTLSGGHTQLVWVKDYLDMQLLGETRDDAIGEAFDKIAQLMQMPYPGGPWIDHYARNGDPHRFTFPATSMPNLDFSFSGIKTAFRYFVREQEAQNPDFIAQHRDDLCASIQQTLINMVLEKLKSAVAQTGISAVGIAGGVAANTALRRCLTQWAQQLGWQVLIPQPAYCTDNAAMIALAAHHQYIQRDFCDMDVAPLPKMPV
ncbi:MAG: tRNA (adenosine(37)-N6)-threonylcarbamoyltransferase complex transferase subunit TsaD [Bacteroidota bacterium]